MPSLHKRPRGFRRKLAARRTGNLRQARPECPKFPESARAVPALRWPARTSDLVTVGCVLAALAVVYFHALPRLGLYNDDYYNVGFPACLTFQQVLKQCAQWLVAWPVGRPLGACFSWLMAAILVRVGGIHAIYILPFALVALSSYLIYNLVSRATTPLAGFVAAISYAISPVDTLRMQYTGAAFYQACIALTLVALILYRNGQHALAYATLVCSFLFHECAILGFLAAPLLTASARRLPRELVKNGIIVLCVIGSVLFVRSELMHESRSLAIAASAHDMVYRGLKSAELGPLTQIELVGLRTVQSFTRPLRAGVGGTLSVLTILIGVCSVLILAQPDPPRTFSKVPGLLTRIDERAKLSRNLLWGCARVFGAGLMIFDFNYFVFFLDPYYPANHIAGMIALVHTAPGVGVSFCLGALAALFLAALNVFRLPLAALALISLSLGGFGAWGSLIRSQYEESWRNQQLFWRHITKLVPDQTDGTITIVEAEKPYDLPFTWIIQSHSWADTLVPRMLYQSNWSTPPMLYVLDPSWRNGVQNRSGGLYWLRPPSLGIPGWEELPQGNIVLIRASNGNLTRLQGTLNLSAGIIRLKAQANSGNEPLLKDDPVRRSLLSN